MSVVEFAGGTMFTLTRLEFERGKQRFILQGMVHVGPKWLYEEIQKELDEYVRSGFQLFLEGFADDRGDSMPQWQLEIIRYIEGILNFYKLLGKRKKLHLEKQTLRYPEGLIWADTTVGELAREIKRREVNIPSELVAFFHDPVCKKIMKGRRVPENLKEEKGKKFLELGGVEISAQVMTIMREFRNDVAVDHLEGYMSTQPEGKAYMHYGQSHVPGIRELAEALGWKLVGEPRILEFNEDSEEE